MTSHVAFKILEISPLYNKIMLEIFANGATFKLLTDCNINDFLLEIERIYMTQKNMIAVGDFNINLLAENWYCDSYKSIIETSGYRLLNTISLESATRCTCTTCSLIDHAITDLMPELVPNCVEVIDTCLTDHKALLFDYNINRLKKKSEMVTKHFHKVDSSKFIDLVRLYIHHIINPTIIELIEILKQAKFLSTTTVRKRVRSESFNWITLDILKLMKKETNRTKNSQKIVQTRTWNKSMKSLMHKSKHKFANQKLTIFTKNFWMLTLVRKCGLL